MRVPHSVLFHMASNQNPCVSTRGAFITFVNNTPMLALLKTISNKMEELASRAVRQDPFKVQEGGEHYKEMRIQPAEFIHANNVPYLEGCVIKYLCRHRRKGGKLDLLKAKHYIDLIIELEYRHEP